MLCGRDAQCGFKAVSSAAVTALLPWVRSSGWFFDTELLLLARRAGYTVREVPVAWTDDRFAPLSPLADRAAHPHCLSEALSLRDHVQAKRGRANVTPWAAFWLTGPDGAALRRRDSRVRLLPTIWEMFSGLLWLRFRRRRNLPPPRPAAAPTDSRLQQL
jgi:hypothetical protein